MTDILLNTALILSILIILPAFITMLMIIKEYAISSIRFSRYFKLLQFQIFIHSIYLVAYLFEPNILNPLLVVSLTMLPIYTLLLFRLFYLKYEKESRIKVHKEVLKASSKKDRIRARLKRENLRLVRKSKWTWR